MEKLKVFVPCAGLGTRIGSITKSLPKALLKIGNKAALSYVLETYPPDTEFVVQVGYLGHLVREYVQLAHPDLNITIIDLDKFEGPGSSLAYGISQAEQYLQGPWIFHSCDAILFQDYKMYWGPGNWLGYTVAANMAQYRTLKVKNNEVITILEKGELDNNLAFVGVFGITDWKAFWHQYELHGVENFTSDADVLNAMLDSGNKFNALRLNWYDTGNPDAFRETQAHLASLENSDPYLLKEDQSVYVFDAYVVKFFSNPSIVTDMCARGRMIEGTPEILESTTHFFKYEKGKGELFSKMCDKHTYKKFLKAASANWKFEYEYEPDFVKSFYINKTLDRIRHTIELHDDLDIIPLINGTHVLPAFDMIRSIEFKEIDICSVSTRVHGDLHNSNVIYDAETDKFTFIDWRPNFGTGVYFGDVYYDLAKIMHGLIVDHSIVNQNQFSVVYDTESCTIDILRPNRLVECEQVFRSWCVAKGYSLKKIDLLTALIFLNIAPLHHDPYSKFLFLLGKYLLATFLAKHPDYYTSY